MSPQQHVQYAAPYLSSQPMVQHGGHVVPGGAHVGPGAAAHAIVAPPGGSVLHLQPTLATVAGGRLPGTVGVQ